MKVGKNDTAESNWASARAHARAHTHTHTHTHRENKNQKKSKIADWKDKKGRK